MRTQSSLQPRSITVAWVTKQRWDPSNKRGGHGRLLAREAGRRSRHFAEIYDPESNAWTVSTDTLYTGGFFHAQAKLGDTGVLICGGLNAAFTFRAPNVRLSSRTEASSTHLTWVSPCCMRSSPILETVVHCSPADWSHPQRPKALPLSSDLSATSSAWVLDDGTWRPVGSMSIARAMHSTTRTSDGRVVIAGGVSRIDAASDRNEQAYGGLLYDAADALPCVEIFDPVTTSFTALSACNAGSTSGALPSPVALPTIADDPVFGTLITGGLSTDPRESSVQRTLLYPRFSDRNQGE